MPSISIVIPVYNAAVFLRECIDSILSQSFHDFEILLVDDGSKDESGAICDEYAHKDFRVRVFHQKNQGVSAARNLALDNANGEWIAFVDADDKMIEKALELEYKCAVSQNVDVVLGGSQVLVNEKLTPYHIYKYLLSSRVFDYMNHPALWGYLIRANVIRNNNIRFIPGLKYSEDVVFLANVAINSKSIAHISDFVYIYRRNDTSACATTDGVMSSGHQFRAAYAIKQLADNEMETDKKEFLYNKHKMLIRGGCFDYARLSFSFKNYKKYESQYLQYFDDKANLFFQTIKARIIVLRRKLISFQDSPLSGQDGIITRIKHIFG